MKRNISIVLFVSILALVSCSKDDDSTPPEEEVQVLKNAKRVVTNAFSQQGNLAATTLYEFSYNENNLLSAIKITDVSGVKNRTISYNADKKIAQITQTSGNAAQIFNVTYTGENATVSISGRNNPYILTYNSATNTYDYSNGTDSGSLVYGENENLIEVSSNNNVLFSKKIVPSIKGVYTNQDKLLPFISSFFSIEEILFFDRNAASTLSFGSENFSFTNESENGSLTHYTMTDTTTQAKIFDVVITY